MKAVAIVQLILWMFVCLCSVAAEPTNSPVRVTISKVTDPFESRIIVTATNTIDHLVKLFPGFEGQPSGRFRRSAWLFGYSVDIAFADGHSRTIYVANNSWTAGGPPTPLVPNWDELLESMTSSLFKQSTSFAWDRLVQTNETRTLIIGPYETVPSRAKDTKGQDGSANGSQPIRSENNRTPSAAGSRR